MLAIIFVAPALMSSTKIRLCTLLSWENRPTSKHTCIRTISIFVCNISASTVQHGYSCVADRNEGLWIGKWTILPGEKKISGSTAYYYKGDEESNMHFHVSMDFADTAVSNTHTREQAVWTCTYTCCVFQRSPIYVCRMIFLLKI